MTLSEYERIYASSILPSDALSDLQNIYDQSSQHSLERARTAFLIGLIYMRSNSEKGFELWDELYDCGVRLKNNEILATAFHCKAVKAFYQNDLRRASSFAEEALELATKSENRRAAAQALDALGNIALRFGALKQAIDYLTRSLEIAQKYGFVLLESRLYSLLSGVYLQSGIFARAKNYALQSLETAKRLNSQRDILNSNLKLATVELELQHYDEVERIIDEIRPQLPKDDLSFSTLVSHLLANLYAGRGKWKNAETEFKTALETAIYPNNERVRSNIYLQYAGFLLDRKRNKDALASGLKALENAQTANDDYGIKEALRLVHQCYKVLGKFKEAHKYLEQYNELVSRSDNALLQNILEYHALQSELELEKSKAESRKKESERLRIELERKENELMEKTRHLIKQTEALTQFKNDLEALVKRSSPSDPQVRQIKERLKSLPESQLNWQDFDQEFKAVHPEFVTALGKRFPDLTTMEKKICALLRINLSSPDIAKLFFLSERNIQNHRYRIRKKLKLETNDNIHEFLAQIA